MAGKGLFTYTTEIEPSRTIGEIQEVLVRHGATAMMTKFNQQGAIESLQFQILIDNQPRTIRLPCDPVPVFKVLERQYQERKIPRQFVNEQQALRVSWRIVKYWVDAQMAILETQMVKMEQIFLPYMVMRDGKTLFEGMVKTGFKLLGGKIETTIQNQAEEGEVLELKEVEDTP